MSSSTLTLRPTSAYFSPSSIQVAGLPLPLPSFSMLIMSASKSCCARRVAPRNLTHRLALVASFDRLANLVRGELRPACHLDATPTRGWSHSNPARHARSAAPPRPAKPRLSRPESSLDNPSQELAEQPVHFLRRVLLRPMRDAGQPFDAQIADVTFGAVVWTDFLTFPNSSPCRRVCWRRSRASSRGVLSLLPRLDAPRPSPASP
jgi:hypothetical protein